MQATVALHGKRIYLDRMAQSVASIGIRRYSNSGKRIAIVRVWSKKSADSQM